MHCDYNNKFELKQKKSLLSQFKHILRLNTYQQICKHNLFS
jgi:hypothetical protein